MKNKKIISVLGAGSFGTAIADIAAKNGQDVRLWMRSERQQKEIKQTKINSRYLPKYKLNQGIVPLLDIKEAVDGADHLFVAVPSKSVRTVVSEALNYLPETAKLLSLTKGIDPENSIDIF